MLEPNMRFYAKRAERSHCYVGVFSETSVMLIGPPNMDQEEVFKVIVRMRDRSNGKFNHR